MLVWDNVGLHLTAGVKEFIDANADWLTVFQLPAYAPDFNPTEGIWALVKRDLGNLASVRSPEPCETSTQGDPVPPRPRRRLPPA